MLQSTSEVCQRAEKMRSGAEILSALGEIDVGMTPKTLVYEEGKLKLYRYNAFPLAAKDKVKRPLLITYALVNRPYILDLQPDKSLIRGLLERGLDVFLIDWGYPDGSDRFLTLEDYILRYMDTCVDVVCDLTQQSAINMLGVCQGGVFTLCYSALFPKRIHSLVTMVTPVDFASKDNLLAHLVKSIDVDLLVDTMGNVPGTVLNSVYLSLKPYELSSRKYVDMLEIIDDADKAKSFMRMEKWIFDSPDQAGEAFRQFTKALFQENQLMHGQFTLGSYKVDLQKVAMPVLNVYASQDHLVPPSAAKPLKRCVGSKNYSELEFDSGHIGIYVSGRAQRTIPPKIAEWVRAQN
jgi:polyhydroxyalkanoate synthase